jgi:bifunctional DNase/RNase
MKCTTLDCVNEAQVRVLHVRNRRAGQEEFLCDQHLQLVLESYHRESRRGVGSDSGIGWATAFELELLVADQRADLHTVMLREVGSSRVLVLPIAYLEICILFYAVHDSPYNQWTLPVAMAKVIKHFGAQIAHVVIDEYHVDGYFKAKAVIQYDDRQIEVQLRPSDGLAFAILNNLPFLVSRELLK